MSNLPLRSDGSARARLKLRHLELLVALDDAPNLVGAAQRLGISQPAASRLLGEIEAIVGAAICDRTARGLSANAHGGVLMRRARIALAQLDLAADELGELRAGLGGSVTFGAVTAPAVDTVVQVLAGLQRTHPKLKVTVEVDTSLPLVRGLLEGKLDFALARMPPDTDAALLVYREVAEEALDFLVRDGHPLLGRQRLQLVDIADAGWVLEPPGTLLRRRVEAAFRRAGLPPPARVLNTRSVLLALAAVAQSDMVGAVTASVARLFAAGGIVRPLPPLVDAARVAVEPFGLIRHHDRAFSPAAEIVFSAIQGALFGG